MTAETRADIYSRITTEIVAAIEAGAGEWHMPWHHSGGSIARPANVASGKPYRGINTLALWIAAQSRGYASGIWGTYRQWQALGAQVRKGERSTAIIFWKRIAAVQDEQDVEDADDRPHFIARGYAVFNRSQVDGYEPPAVDALPEAARIPQAEAFIAALGIPATFEADAAYYRIDLDRIFMPAFAAFEDPLSYIATYIHEAGHYAVSRIMPHDRVWRLLCLLSAMRQFGIIRAIRKRRSSVVSGPLVIRYTHKSGSAFAPTPASTSQRLKVF